MKYDRIISVGCLCHVAYQIRRFTGDTTAFFFDWLYTPFEGLLQALENDFTGAFQRENLVFAHDDLSINRTVRDSKTGFDLFHYLPKDVDGGVKVNVLDAEFPQLKARFEYLSSRWLRTMNGARILFVRQVAERRPEPSVKALAEVLSRKYPTLDFDILAVTMTDTGHTKFSVDPDTPRILSAQVKKDKWPGDSVSWDAAFEQAINR